MESEANNSNEYSHSQSQSPSAPNSCSMAVGNNNNGVDHQENGHTRANKLLLPQYPIRYNCHGHNRGVNGSMGSSSSGLLIRQSSSPPGFFSQFITTPQQNGGGYGIEKYRLGDHGATNGDSPSSSITLKKHLRFLSGSPSLGSSSSRFIEVSEYQHCAKVGTDTISIIRDNSFLTSGSFPAFCSWSDPTSHLSENFSTIKREPDNDHKLFTPCQQGMPGSRLGSTALSRHPSLPRTSSSEMLAMEKLLQLHDTVPCKVRAKRGCATHPRSIAERARRTRISERMRKLQELVPNMDKQTNTADMLDLAVDYIKSLQKQYKVLNDNHANCNCSASQQ